MDHIAVLGKLMENYCKFSRKVVDINIGFIQTRPNILSWLENETRA